MSKITFTQFLTMSNTSLMKLHRKDLVAAIKDIKAAYNTAKFDTSDVDSMSVRLMESLDEHNKCKNNCSELSTRLNDVLSTLKLEKASFNKLHDKYSALQIELSKLEGKKCFWDYLKFW